MPGELFGPITVSDALLEATSDRAWLQAMLDAEAALAQAEAEVGVIPGDAAAAIAGRCQAERFDIGHLGRSAREGGNPVIPLVAALKAAVPAPHNEVVHWGATSQDILDTAAMLVARRSVAMITTDLERLAAACAELAEAHRATLMAGRTLLQQAVPVTFGLKAAQWLAAVTDVQSALADADAALAAQLGGAAGTLASLGSDGPQVVEAFARRLRLAEPALPWHTARQRMARLAGALGLIAGTMAKISRDVALLMQTEVAEAAEPGPGGSSTMPHKRNPVSAAVVDAAARRAIALLPVLYGALVAEHERPAGAWHAEWETLGELLALAGGAASRTADTVSGLEIDADAMAANLDRSGGQLLAERVSLALAPRMGRAEAAEAVAAAGRRARGGGRSFADELATDASISAVVKPGEIAEWLRPEGYLGATDTWIDRTLARLKGNDA